MPHARQQIRDFVVAGLAGLPSTADRVYPGRARRLSPGHEPALLVYTRSETSERAIRGVPPKLERRCTLHIEGRVSTATPPDDLLDDISLDIETGIAALIDYAAQRFFGGLAQNVQMTATELIAEAGADGERIIGGVRVEYLVTYRTVEGAPGAIA